MYPPTPKRNPPPARTSKKYFRMGDLISNDNTKERLGYFIAENRLDGQNHRKRIVRR